MLFVQSGTNRRDSGTSFHTAFADDENHKELLLDMFVKDGE